MRDPLSAASTYENILKVQRWMTSLAKQYTQIVSNGHADNPFKQDDRESDGYNFLSSRDRYMLASAILTELNKMDWQLTIIIYASSQKSAKLKILQYVDFKTYCAQWEAKRTCDRIIDKINKLKERADDL